MRKKDLAAVGTTAAIIMTLVACGSTNSPVAIAPPSTFGLATGVYVVQRPVSNSGSLTGPGSILDFAASSNGSATPASTLTMPVGLDLQVVATDSLGQVYAGGTLNDGSTEILVYPAGASGTASPVRTIQVVASTPLVSCSATGPSSLAVDSSEFLYVADSSGCIAVFSSTASGQIAPERLIVGPLTQLGAPNGIAVDGAGYVYVTNSPGAGQQGDVLVFSPTATGNVAPARIITGTTAAPFVFNVGVAADKSGDVYVLTGTEGTGAYFSILEFPPNATGNAQPIKVISGTATTLAEGASSLAGLRVDNAGNIYVACSSPNIGPFVAKFAASSSGNIAPTNEFKSTSWSSPGFLQLGVY